MTIKRLMLVWVMILCLVPIYACADFDYSTRDYDVSEDDLVAAVEADYPDWELIDSEQYWTGRWENELACRVDISLMRVTDCTLYQKTLSVIINPLKQGDPVPWEITNWAPIPLTEEAMCTLLEMDPADLYTTEEGYANQPYMLTQSIVSGCAPFLLGEGESWSALFSYPDALAGVVVNAEGHRCIRIAHWDGEQYDSVTSSRFFSEDRFSINAITQAGIRSQSFAEPVIHSLCASRTVAGSSLELLMATGRCTGFMTILSPTQTNWPSATAMMSSITGLLRSSVN